MGLSKQPHPHAAWSPNVKLFTSPNGNPKIAKSNKSTEYASLILHLAPACTSGHEVCPSRSQGCTKACLNTAGWGRYDRIQQSRIKRTIMWFKQRKQFKEQLAREIKNFVARCSKVNKKPCIRLNGTSDIAWEVKWPSLFRQFPTVQFYDYTKIYPRMVGLKSWPLPQNYSLTFSQTENNKRKCEMVLGDGGNVATVFEGDFPSTWLGYPTHSGEENDMRFLDPPGVVCLTAKGRARHDTTGFVVRGV